MERLLLKDFISTEVNSEYSKSQYRQYKKLTDAQIEKIISLTPHIGEEILYKRGEKMVKMILVHIPMYLGQKCKNGQYSSYPYNIRLDYAEAPKRGVREWAGFWTWNIDKITLIKE